MEKQVSPGWNGLEDRWWDSLYILARLKPGVSVSQAEASINVLAKAIWRDFAGPIIPPHLAIDGTRAPDRCHHLLPARIR